MLGINSSYLRRKLVCKNKKKKIFACLQLKSRYELLGFQRCAFSALCPTESKFMLGEFRPITYSLALKLRLILSVLSQ